MAVPPDFSKNLLLAALSDDERQHMLARLELVDMRLGQALYEPGSQPALVYFPSTAIVSLMVDIENGGSAQVAMVGNEGVVGISLFLGGGFTLGRAVVLSAGHGFVMPAHELANDFARSELVRQVLLRYTQALITQMSQTAVCNRHHTLDRQLSRWLLMSLDRLHGNQLVMTHELIAHVLGVRREGVTEAALKLQAAGLIRYARGHISVLDRQGLELRSCECYGVVKKEYARLMQPATNI